MQVVEPDGAPGRKVVVIHGHRRAQRVLHRLASAVARGAEVFDELDAALARAPDVAVVDLAAAELDLPARHAGVAWVAVPGDGTAPGAPARAAALLEAGWRHVVTQPVPLFGEEILAALGCLVGRARPHLAPLLLGGVAISRVRLDDAADREAAVAALVADAVAMGLSDRIASLASVIADELVANAIDAAPVDDAGARVHAADPRELARPLAGPGEVELAWGADGRYLAIEVVDRWGSLETGALGPRLAAGIRGAAGEPGGGLALVHACCQRLHVAVEPGRETRVIALLDLRYRATALARAGSVHLTG